MVSYAGRGLFNKLLNKLPFELHIPGYQFCGPGTELEKRLRRGDRGVNELDAACREHDIAYRDHKENLTKRHEADLSLAERAWRRLKSHDSSIGEKIAAWGITNAMKAKVKFGMGHAKRQKTATLGNIVIAVRRSLKKKYKSGKGLPLLGASKYALAVAKKAIKGRRISKGRIRKSGPRIIPIPKRGGILPLLPIFAGLSALGTLSGGAAAIAKAVNDAKSAKEKLDEAKRHNRSMESISLGKKGAGLYLGRRKNGFGLYLNPYRPKN